MKITRSYLKKIIKEELSRIKEGHVENWLSGPDYRLDPEPETKINPVYQRVFQKIKNIDLLELDRKNRVAYNAIKEVLFYLSIPVDQYGDLSNVNFESKYADLSKRTSGFAKQEKSKLDHNLDKLNIILQ